MMKIIATLFFVAFAINAVSATEMRCSLEQPDIPTEWIDLKGECYAAMRAQIQKEIDASFTYLSMAAHFSRDTINRPGFASLFFGASKEEREHASKLIEYLSMRGTLTNDVTELIKIPTVKQHTWESAAAALEDALVLETSVTQSIRRLIQSCEKKPNYFHLVDYLTGEFLDEQLKGQRDLAGKLNTLKKMMVSQGALAEFLFDKDLSE